MLPLVSNASLRGLLLLMLWEHLHGRCIWLCLRLLRRLSCWLLWRLCWRLLGHLPRGHLLQLLLRQGLLRLLLQLQLRLQNGLLLLLQLLLHLLELLHLLQLLHLVLKQLLYRIIGR